MIKMKIDVAPFKIRNCSRKIERQTDESKLIFVL